MSHRIVLIIALLAALLVTRTPLQAHVGGHDVQTGATLHAWTEPGTGARIPGSVLFVSGDAVHVEDFAGLVHVWPITALERTDRDIVQRFRAATAELNAVRHRSDPPAPVTGAAQASWIVVAACMSGLLMLRAGVSRVVMTRAAVGGLVITLPLGCGGGGTPASSTPAGPTPIASPGPSAPLPLESYFNAFPTHVRTRTDGQYLYVESDGMADHVLMVGIRSWQQQVPLPQAYTGTNAWRIPTSPRLADQPVSARTGLFRGAIALAVNGVPIFNALNNRGDDALLAGELDEFGGHAGRADDYHYHTAPLFLNATVGPTQPIAVALDGFPLYGGVEPDGSAMRPLDEYNGHADGASTYHYHGTRTYPYINGGMKGVVTVSDQVEPQPAATPVRPAGTPLSGATITRHTSTGSNAWTLEYQVGGRLYRIDYRIEGTRYTFVFIDPSGATRTETYTR